MSGVRHFTVEQDDDGQRLDRWIKRHVPDMPYVTAQKLMRKGQIRVDSKRAKPDTRLAEGQDIRIPPFESKAPQNAGAGGGKMRLSDGDIAYIKSLVVYQDEDIIAINKPAGLAVQGGTNTKRHIDGLLEGLKNKDGVKPRLVHRLDKDTSGILLVARSAKMATKLGEMFKRREIKKIYWALVSPRPEMLDGTIKAPLVKAGGRDREKMVVDDQDGKFALTDYAVLEHAGDEAAFLALWPRTGRTHQLRVHCQLLGCSILGDHKYKSERDPEAKKPEADMGALPLASRLHLHARRLILNHPSRPGVVDITAPLPPELLKSWRALGFDPNTKTDPFEI